MKKKLHACSKLFFLSLLFSVSSVGAQTVIDVDASASWIGYANFFNLDAENTYAGGSEWGVADIKTVINTEANSLTLHPNFNAYNANDAFWANGAIGNKLFEGNTYVQNDALITEEIEFTGHTSSNTLAQGYEAVAFIKVLSTDYQLLQYLPVPLIADENFSITLDVATIDGAAHVQYGFSVTGLNANPTQEAALGNAVVTEFEEETGGVAELDKNFFTLYPNPAKDVLNINSAGTVKDILIYNILGQKVVNTILNNERGTVNISSLNSGIYTLIALTESNSISIRFIKE